MRLLSAVVIDGGFVAEVICHLLAQDFLIFNLYPWVIYPKIAIGSCCWIFISDVGSYLFKFSSRDVILFNKPDFFSEFFC